MDMKGVASTPVLDHTDLAALQTTKSGHPSEVIAVGLLPTLLPTEFSEAAGRVAVSAGMSPRIRARPRTLRHRRNSIAIRPLLFTQIAAALAPI